MDSEDEGFYYSGDTDYNSSNSGDASAEDSGDDNEANYAAVSHLQKPYKILTEDDIEQLLDNDVSTVADVLSISRGAACTLLYQNNWNLTSVYDQYFAADQNPQFSAAAAESSQRELGQITCNICYDELTYQNTISAACGHPFCADCWKTYVATAIADGSGCLTLKCPEPGCSAAAGVDLVESLASAGDIDKYHRYLRRSYVEYSRRRKWCPAAGCDFAVEFDGGGVEFDVTCHCSHKFCWNCTAENHRPVACETVASWMEKNNSEAENTGWILAYTKPCPKCSRPIEKSQGCNVMTCSSPCFFRFCWLCGQPFSSHANCNNYPQIVDVRRERAKKYALRYAHYYERWHANEQSRKVAMADLRRWRDGDMAKLGEKQGEGGLHMRFVVEAWEQIVECRRVLKWSYAIGYYMEGESSEKVAFFEYLQGEAEARLERLHHCAEKEMMKYVDIYNEDFKEFRVKLTDLTVVTKNYFENLVKGLENNLAEVVTSRSGRNGRKDLGEKKNEGCTSSRFNDDEKYSRRRATFAAAIYYGKY